MAKPRGRPRGSGDPEDLPALRQALLAIRSGEVRGNHAAARRFGSSLPGDPKTNARRLYRRLREHGPDIEALEAELDSEEEEAADEDVVSLAAELVWKPFEVQEARLTRTFRADAKRKALVASVLRNLKEEGVELSDENIRKLGDIARYIQLLVLQETDEHEIKRLRSRKRIKRLNEKVRPGLPSESEQE